MSVKESNRCTGSLMNEPQDLGPAVHLYQIALQEFFMRASAHTQRDAEARCGRPKSRLEDLFFPGVIRRRNIIGNGFEHVECFVSDIRLFGVIAGAPIWHFKTDEASKMDIWNPALPGPH
jgi:hypothetical protein